MIAPNDKPRGRQPCPCGSGERYRRCCGNPKIKALRIDLIRMRALAHIFLKELCKLTQSPTVAIPMANLRQYPAEPEIKMMMDTTKDILVCSPVSLNRQVIESPRRIVLPARW